MKNSGAGIVMALMVGTAAGCGSSTSAPEQPPNASAPDQPNVSAPDQPQASNALGSVMNDAPELLARVLISPTHALEIYRIGDKRVAYSEIGSYADLPMTTVTDSDLEDPVQLVQKLAPGAPIDERLLAFTGNGAGPLYSSSRESTLPDTVPSAASVPPGQAAPAAPAAPAIPALSPVYVALGPGGSGTVKPPAAAAPAVLAPAPSDLVATSSALSTSTQGGGGPGNCPFNIFSSTSGPLGQFCPSGDVHWCYQNAIGIGADFRPYRTGWALMTVCSDIGTATFDVQLTAAGNTSGSYFYRDTFGVPQGYWRQWHMNTGCSTVYMYGLPARACDNVGVWFQVFNDPSIRFQVGGGWGAY